MRIKEVDACHAMSKIRTNKSTFQLVIMRWTDILKIEILPPGRIQIFRHVGGSLIPEEGLAGNLKSLLSFLSCY